MSTKLFTIIATVATAALLSTAAANAAPNGPHGQFKQVHPHPNFKPHFPHHPPHWVHHHHPRWYVGYRYRPRYVAPVAYAVSRPAPTTDRCSCLSKEYTPEGAVLFKDLCTNEAAMNPPVQAAPPQRTGLYQPTPSNALPQQPIPQAQ